MQGGFTITNAEHSIVLQGKLGFADFRRFLIYHTLQAGPIAFLVLLLASAILFQVLSDQQLSLWWTMVLSLFTTVLGILLLLAITHRQARTAFKSDSLLKLEQTLLINQEGVTLKTDQSNAIFQWTDVISAYEYKDMFVLYISKVKAIVIPTGYFAAPTDMATFQELVTTYLLSDQVHFQPDVSEVSGTARLQAALAHALALLPIPGLTIALTATYWLLIQHRAPFARYHGRQSLNFQISIHLYLVLLLLSQFAGTRIAGSFLPGPAAIVFGLVFNLLAVAFLIAMVVFFTVTIIIAIVAALSGKRFRYPLVITFLK